MRFRNSEVPLKITKRARRGNILTRLRWFVDDSQRRWEARREKLAERKRLLRAANRRYRRSLGFGFKNA